MSQKPTSGAKENFIRSFGRRRSKGLRPTRAEAMDEILPQTTLFPLAEGEVLFDPKSFFNFPVKDVWFEIGFGNGEHLLHQALNNPEVGFIGCEPFMNGVSALCVEIKEKGVKNIRIWPEDARLLMERLKEKSLGRLFLLHPDPWPKTRHYKRRFVQTETLDQMAELLKPDAEFRMATDHQNLAAWMLEKTYFHPAFQWMAQSAEDWRNSPVDCPKTRYGQKGIAQGRPPVYFNFRKNKV